MRVVNDNCYSKGIIRRTREVWESRPGQELSDGAAQRIATDVASFFSILTEWSGARLVEEGNLVWGSLDRSRQFLDPTLKTCALASSSKANRSGKSTRSETSPVSGNVGPYVDPIPWEEAGAVS